MDEGGGDLTAVDPVLSSDVNTCGPNPPYFAQVGSLLRITGFPTTISRDRALVTATLNRCRGPRQEMDKKQLF